MASREKASRPGRGGIWRAYCEVAAYAAAARDVQEVDAACRQGSARDGVAGLAHSAALRLDVLSAREAHDSARSRVRWGSCGPSSVRWSPRSSSSASSSEEA